MTGDQDEALQKYNDEMDDPAQQRNQPAVRPPSDPEPPTTMAARVLTAADGQEGKIWGFQH